MYASLACTQMWLQDPELIKNLHFVDGVYFDALLNNAKNVTELCTRPVQYIYTIRINNILL